MRKVIRKKNEQMIGVGMGSEGLGLLCDIWAENWVLEGGQPGEHLEE